VILNKMNVGRVPKAARFHVTSGFDS